MTWIGLRDTHEAVFSPQGLDQNPVAAYDPDQVLACGTIQLECTYDRGHGRTILAGFATQTPWISELAIGFEENGQVFFAQRQGHVLCQAVLPNDLISPAHRLILTYSWNGPARRGSLSLHDTDRNLIWQADVANPIPLTLRDVDLLISPSNALPLGADVAWIGVSDQIEPIGPMPSMDGRIRLSTTEGHIALQDLRPGQVVHTADGDIAQIRWAGYADVIARGRFAPITMRAPYHGLHKHVIVGPEQRVRLTGSEVEYLFGEEEVSACASHLRDGRSVIPAPQMYVMRYYQVVLDRQTAMDAEGAPLESLDASAILADGGLLPHSILRDVPREVLPKHTASETALLERFEAMTVAHSRNG